MSILTNLLFPLLYSFTLVLEIGRINFGLKTATTTAFPLSCLQNNSLTHARFLGWQYGRKDWVGHVKVRTPHEGRRMLGLVVPPVCKEAGSIEAGSENLICLESLTWQ